ncbi:MAG TPA: MFS transporter, partial [Burkholderiaceae bacterium]
MSPSLIALCFGNFVIGTGTLIVPGMLPKLAEGLGVTLPVAGQLITAFAFTVCVGAPLLAAATSRYDRRALLFWMQILFFAGHAAAAQTSEFAPMVLVRVLTSIGAAVFTAQAGATAALLVAPEKRGAAVAFVFLGWAIASVVGLPLGAYVGATLGWRAGFWMVAAGSLAGAAAVRSFVPASLAVKRVDASMWRGIFSSAVLMAVVGVTALQAAAQFSIYSYFVPAARDFLAASPALVSTVLLVFGVMGVTGNALSSRFVDRIGAANVALASMVAMLAAHLIWPFAVGSLALFVALVVAWGLGCFAANSSQQARLVALSPQYAPVSLALNTSAIYLGQALGTAAGGVLLTQRPGLPGYVALAWISVPMFVAAIALSLAAQRATAVT